MPSIDFNFSEYMVDVAERHIDVMHSATETHYYPITTTAGLEVPSGAKDVAPFIEPVIAVDESDFDNSTSTSFYTFFVLDKQEPMCVSIAKDIIAKMKYDSAMNQCGLRGLRADSISLQSMPAIGPYFVAMVTFVVVKVNNVVYNASRWQQ